ncbi:hypothetical protein GUJ93_ZPchr0005g15609 [Zizania palustris]|uniref:Uncharacterized protein n=1 Tax=Zizania palustris TaxID=103762 RepID=A0A8J5SGR9_ZIZPA|nr:hypothetical protein GUJ93_ZPchr0005g15609 [Zizania palustris]KAG8068366.1 hypothetical protein GUJ93_ZPchr0005g15609 [Zizania palustris]KAG8068367.1 hypothetical protein GUJ93_ZPchr0005g15609 [Zizania palustris]
MEMLNLRQKMSQRPKGNNIFEVPSGHRICIVQDREDTTNIVSAFRKSYFCISMSMIWNIVGSVVQLELASSKALLQDGGHVSQHINPLGTISVILHHISMMQGNFLSSE